MDIVISMVIYNNSFQEIEKCLEELNKIKLDKTICIVDNSDKTSLHKPDLNKYNIKYYKMNKNLGFGKAHNFIFKKYLDLTNVFFIINPDIFISATDIEKGYQVINENKNIAILAPKVIQDNIGVKEGYHLSSTCHLLPTPFNLFAKRFFPKFFKSSIDQYNLEFMDKEKVQFIPNLSGCCLFIKADCLKKIGFFDYRFFLYMEDVDFVRRMAKYFDTLYYPEITAVHSRGSLSYKKIKYLLIHISSAIKYFNKWGWVIDNERKEINNHTLKLINHFYINKKK
jgi:GT2 family glycosyltransferase